MKMYTTHFYFVFQYPTQVDNALPNKQVVWMLIICFLYELKDPFQSNISRSKYFLIFIYEFNK